MIELNLFYLQENVQCVTWVTSAKLYALKRHHLVKHEIQFG